MKRQIHAYRGHGEIAVEGHNIKLGRGGIREIEFFVQTQQLIAGGRHPGIARPRHARHARQARAKDGWIDADARDDLKAAYRFLRTVEHRLQMVADEQTHTLPAEREDLERFARFLGFADRDAFAEVLLGHLRKVQRHYARLFENGAPAPTGRRCRFPPTPTTARRSTGSPSMGFRAAAGSLGDRAPLARRRLSLAAQASSRARNLPSLCRCCSSSWRAPTIRTPRWCCSTISSPGCTAAARLLSLLRQNPDLIALIALMLGTAPRLADILARNPQVMDALLDPSFLRRACRTTTKLGAASSTRALGAIALRRGLARPHPHVRAGTHVPDRRAHPVRHGDGASRRARPSRGSPTR